VAVVVVVPVGSGAGAGVGGAVATANVVQMREGIEFKPSCTSNSQSDENGIDSGGLLVVQVV
jgi:hypothetical protein